MGIRWGLFGKTEIPDREDPSRTYLRRWRLIETPLGGVKVHHILLSDRPELSGLHDHPWSFVSVQLRGRYHEWVPHPAGGTRVRTHRWVNVVRAEEPHAVIISRQPCWTLVFNGRRRREWGFLKDGRWTPWFEVDAPAARNVRGRAGSTEENRPGAGGR